MKRFLTVLALALVIFAGVAFATATVAAWRLAPAASPLYILITQARPALVEIGQRLHLDPYVTEHLGLLWPLIGAFGLFVLRELLFAKGLRRTLAIAGVFFLATALPLVQIAGGFKIFCVNVLPQY